MHKWTRIIRLMVLALLSLTLAGCSDQEKQATELRIGLIAPITGPLSKVGQSSVEAAELAVKEINNAGVLSTLEGAVRVVLLIEDSQDQPAMAVSAALTLINRDRVNAIVGPQVSRNAIPAARVAERAQIPLISPGSTHPDTTREKAWVFRVAFIDTFQGKVMARFAHEELNLQKVALLFDITSEYNQGLAEVFKATFEELGGEVVAFEPYTRDMPDVSEQLARISLSESQALFLPNYHNEVPDQVRQARAAGLQTQLLGTDSWAQIPTVYRRIVEGAYFSTHYTSTSTDPMTLGFIARYRQAYDRTPDDIAALTYDAFGLLVQAVQNQASIDPGSIRDGLAKNDNYQGVTGNLIYRGSGDPVKSAVVMQVRDGQFLFHSRIEPAKSAD
ncbi:ABC transporter substrate-binding protein [Amphritea balenae]|uniref:Ethanolamine utilization protein EutJ n=1 Tax=Amphritea balenae TaxID=452629 RepID=A0A3P1SR55_9GAMM|nr:ABC transporter substrate-binding protein [Amphritea balenae]RRC99590.1 ethanolamine utilization protein EutJ [Amphritea balenae]GGK78278.1 branched-chain amino acid ABC transporter substrate-binding protein [Amphritea balenae]